MRRRRIFSSWPAKMDVHTPFIFVPHPSRPRTWLRTAKLVTFANLGLFAHANYGMDAVPFSVEEYKG